MAGPLADRAGRPPPSGPARHLLPLGQGELSADHAWRALRRYGGWPLLRDALVRFRYGDGFSHARRWACSCAWARCPC